MEKEYDTLSEAILEVPEAEESEGSSEETTTESATEKKTETQDDPSHQGENQDAGEDDEEEIVVEDETEDNTDTKKQHANFNDHPRFKELIEGRKQDKETINQLQEQIKELTAFMESSKKTKEQSEAEKLEIPEWFKNMVGDDEQSVDFLKGIQKLIDERANSALTLAEKKKLQEEKEREEAIAKASKQIDEQLQALRDSGKTFEKNELLAIAKEYGANGYYLPFDKAYEILELRRSNKKSDKTSEKMKVAALTSKGKPSESTEHINILGQMGRFN